MGDDPVKLVRGQWTQAATLRNIWFRRDRGGQRFLASHHVSPVFETMQNEVGKKANEISLGGWFVRGGAFRGTTSCSVGEKKKRPQMGALFGFCTWP